MSDRFDNYQFSLFKGGIKTKKPTQTLTLTETVALIGGTAYEMSTRELRALEPDLQKVFKADLDYVTFSGTFTPTRLVKNLHQHSGLICLDFDHVANLFETRLQLQADPHTLVLFTSPSGTGLKMLMVVPGLVDDPERHKGFFQDIAIYIRQTYGLDVDASGSDVSRACFLVHDPQVFTNPDADAYIYRGLASDEHQRAKKPPTEAQVIKDASDVYKHVLAVVERIEAAQVDISGGSGEYDQRLLLAFCMSTLGDAGRELLHRVLAFYPNYTAEETDAKFDEGRDKSRFTTPWKFFDIAKQHGIDVARPGNKKKEKPSVEHVPRNQGADNESSGGKAAADKTKKSKKDKPSFDFTSPVLYYEDECRILIEAKRGYTTVADNFLLYIKYVTEDEFEQLTWILEIRPYGADSIYIEVPHDDFTSASRLKKIITGKQYSLQLADSELSVLQAYLFRQTKFQRATKIIRYGYHAPSGVFFFANHAVFPGSPLLAPDTFGMVEAKSKDGKPLFLSMPQNNKHKAHRFTLTDQAVTVNQFFQVFAQAHIYENAMLPFCHYTMSLFRDVAIRHKNFSPILYLKGGAGTGKSSLVRVLTAAFGKKQEGVNLKSKNTESALVKLMSQASNTIIWFDEFHNELNGIEGLLQAAYDNDGYHRSKDSTSSDTDAVEIHSALALTSNYLPENPIFFSRCVFIPITSQEKTSEQREAFNQLQEMEDAGLGCLTVELLQYRALVEKEYAAAFELLHKGLKAEFKAEKVPERFFANMAQLMSVTFILASAGKIQVTESTATLEICQDLIALGAANIRRQYRIMAERTALTEFFEIIQSLYDQYQIHEEVHFDFKRQGEENQIRLWFPQLYNLYAQAFRRTFQKAPADKDTLQSEMAALEDFGDWDEMKKSIRFRNDGEGTGQGTTIPRTGCCIMNYDKLRDKYGLSLELRKPKN